MAVLLQLAAQAVSRIGGLALGSGARRSATAALAGVGVSTGILGIPGVDLFPDGRGSFRRRRRRPMFTSTDLAQFAAAESIGGKKAATSLMMIRAAKA